MQWAVLPGHEADWGSGAVALTDITARKKAESHQFLGKHDALTKLRNRAFYDDEIARSTAVDRSRWVCWPSI